jgi:hypothetical protein
VAPFAWRLLFTPSPVFTGEGKRRGCCGFFRNSRDARERVQETVAIMTAKRFGDFF